MEPHIRIQLMTLIVVRFWDIGSLCRSPYPALKKPRLTITYVFVTAYATPITHIQSMTYTGYQERGHTDKGEKGNGGIDDHIRRDSENSGPVPWAKR